MVGLLAFTASAETLSLTYFTGSNGTNNAVAGASTNTYTSGTTFTAANSSGISLQVTASASGTQSSVSTLVFDVSNDNVNWRSSAYRIAMPAFKVAAATTNTTLTLGPIPYLRLTSVENPDAAMLTNVTVKAFIKNGL